MICGFQSVKDHFCAAPFRLTGCVDIDDVKVEHPVRKPCPNNHITGTVVSMCEGTVI